MYSGNNLRNNTRYYNSNGINNNINSANNNIILGPMEIVSERTERYRVINTTQTIPYYTITETYQNIMNGPQKEKVIVTNHIIYQNTNQISNHNNNNTIPNLNQNSNRYLIPILDQNSNRYINPILNQNSNRYIIPILNQNSNRYINPTLNQNSNRHANQANLIQNQNINLRVNNSNQNNNANVAQNNIYNSNVLFNTQNLSDFDKKKDDLFVEMDQYQYKHIQKYDSRRETECAICLEESKRNDIIKEFYKCKHIFHKDCLKNWLKRSNVCPLCKHDLTDEINKIH